MYMKRIFIYILLLCAFACSANDNVFFGKGNKHQISFAGGERIRRGGVEHLYTAFLTYSEPSDFFFLQARNNLELGGFKAKGNDDCSKHSGSVPCNKYNQGVLGISKDVALVHFAGIYTGIGLGAYIKSKSRDDMRVNSAFTFGEKAFLGWNFGAFSTEAYIRHFSNGSLTDKNSGHNFVGASISYNF
ncbi:lipid A 3-O-deacylase PagL [Salmonella enterica]|nr:lipid A 3-O-deacylase PagL [Salmonella enterica]